MQPTAQALASSGMPQGRSGVLRTSCSGLGTQVTPKAPLRQLKKIAHGRELKQVS